ncbi:MAG: hypothetical protein AAF632_20680 [Bacteroidota bacterium]
MFQAEYIIIATTDHFVLIEDQDKGASVTNDAKRVVAELHNTIEGGITYRRVYYRDTEGRFDELKHQNGQFTGYAPCTESQQIFLQNLL